MRVGIDGRLWFETGVGRYIRNLTSELAQIDEKNTYVIFLTQKGYDAYVPPNSRWQKRLVDVHWHTLKEQIVLPFIFGREHLDILHVPYFSIPILYPKRLVVTIHDLTILHNRTGQATTLPMWMYEMRRLGYYCILSIGLKRSSAIFAVSETTKKDIEDNFQINSKNIIVTYEGVENKLLKPQVHTEQAIEEIKNTVKSGSYLLSVGNAYPHKNLTMLLEVFDQLTRVKGNEKLQLVFVGKEDHFTKKLKERVRLLHSADSIVFFGEATDDELTALYRNARALVFPSIAEGFGLPAIEAMAYGCPVICSDIPIFHEILGDRATYFNPKNPLDMLQCMQQITQTSHKPKAFIDSRFSWKKMAIITLAAYESCNRL
jgi:glycosyltransferase involved in cell wall biosynthesis